MINREDVTKAIELYEIARASSIKFANCKAVSRLTLSTQQYALRLHNPLAYDFPADVMFDVNYSLDDLQKFAHSIFLRERENLINLGIQP